jgi:hypothetical protein
MTSGNGGGGDWPMRRGMGTGLHMYECCKFVLVNRAEIQSSFWNLDGRSSFATCSMLDGRTCAKTNAGTIRAGH